MKFLFAVLCALCALSMNALGSPLPKHTDRAFVVDMACKSEHVCILSKDAIESWKSRALDLQTRTGVQATLLVVKGTGDLSFEQYANEAANALKVGTRNNGGVVFLYDIEGRKARLEVSRDLEGAIPDITAGSAITLFNETLAQSENKANSESLARALGVVFEKIDHYATEEHMQKGGKTFVPEKDKSFTYFALTCAVVIIVCSILAVLWYSRRWYYTSGSLLSAVLCGVATFVFPTPHLSLLLICVTAFVTTFICAWIWHRLGDSAGWDMLDGISMNGGRVVSGRMIEGVADYGGGGASGSVESIVTDVLSSSSGSSGSCNPGDCDIGSCDL